MTDAVQRAMKADYVKILGENKKMKQKIANLEKELSSGNIDTKLFAKKSKEYSNLGEIISQAREYLKSIENLQASYFYE